MTDDDAVQTILVTTKNGSSHIMYATANEIFEIIDQDGVVKYDGQPIDSSVGPAISFSDGREFWFQNGRRMLAGTKIIEIAEGRRYLKDGIMHREDGPAQEDADGSVAYYVEGVLHNRAGPAIILADGTKEWFVNGKRHREEGPAIEFASGRKAWFLNGERLSERKFLERVSKPPKTTNEWLVPLASLAIAGLVSIATKKTASKKRLEQAHQEPAVC